MSQLAPSAAAVLRKPYGCMAAQVADGELTIDVRMSRWDIGSLPRGCEIELRLPAWDSPPVFAIAILLRLARTPSATFQTWLNAGNSDDLKVLKHLGTKSDFEVRLVDEDVERAINCQNQLHRRAYNLFKSVSPRIGGWTTEDYNGVVHRVDALYPTISDLWRAASQESIRRL